MRINRCFLHELTRMTPFLDNLLTHGWSVLDGLSVICAPFWVGGWQPDRCTKGGPWVAGRVVPCTPPVTCGTRTAGVHRPLYPSGQGPEGATVPRYGLSTLSPSEREWTPATSVTCEQRRRWVGHMRCRSVQSVVDPSTTDVGCWLAQAHHPV